MKAERLPTHTPVFFAAAVARAAELLRAGEVVALPTETVYGLAANAFDAKAVAKIYEIKGRPAHNPIIIHVAGFELARQCVTTWPDAAALLARSFWPGPLTMVLPRAQVVPEIVTAGGPTVGVRWPSHPFMQAVIRECGFPLAAPSANLSNSVSPTNAEHVCKQLGDRIALVVDGGQSQVGIESTVVDLVAQSPRVLRPGMIHEESLAAALGLPAIAAGTGASRGAETLRSPGLLRKHYSPKAKLMVGSWRTERELGVQLDALEVPRARVHVIAHTCIPLGEDGLNVSVIPHDAEAFARAIYAELHRCDEAGAALILVEPLPAGREWSGIADRLNRAAAVD